jgi:ACS family glucarate transporter-like MFS transporter
MVSLLAFTATASYLCRVNVSVTGGVMMRDLGLSQQTMGQIFSAFLIGYALCQIPAGMLADRFGAPRVLAVAATLWVISTAIIGLGAASLVLLLLGRLLLGIAEAPTFPSSARAIATHLPQHQRGRANGIVLAAIGFGSAIAPPLLSFLMVRLGWRNALLISAVPALMAAMAWLSWKSERSEREASVRFALPRSSQFMLLTFSYTLQGYVGYIFVFWFYIYLTEVRHFDLLRGAAFASLPWLLSIVSIPAGGWLFDRLPGPRWIVPVTGLICSGLLIIVGAYTVNAYLAAACLALATALVLSTEGPFWATMTALAGPHSGAAGGTMNMGSNIGGFVSPALTPILAAHFGWAGALLVSGGLAIIAGLFWLIIGRPTASGEDVQLSADIAA